MACSTAFCTTSIRAAGWPSARLSYINVESRNRSFRVQAFHTFPDDYAIVKSQSLFEVPCGKLTKAE